MRVDAYDPTNTFIGSFDIDRLNAIAAEACHFAFTNQLGPFTYFVCSGRTWTLVPGSSGLELQEGGVHPGQQQAAAISPELVVPTEPVDIETRSGLPTQTEKLLQAIISNQQKQLQTLVVIRWMISAFIIWFGIQFILQRK